MSNALEIDKTVTVGSYQPEDVIILLKNVDGLVEEVTIEQREQAMQKGKSYGQVIPKEDLPSKEYLELFKYSLSNYAKSIARYVAIVSELIVHEKGIDDVVFVSLARAGTPIGILMRRYIKFKYNTDVPHYSISILEGVGLDTNAIKYILGAHPNKKLQFIDGWTGKGFVSKLLETSCEKLRTEEGIDLDPSLAVLADPGQCTNLFGTREDFLIPNACLNSTVSGLLSRTVYSTDIIGPSEFHGAKFFKDFIPHDLSNYYIDSISSHFPSILENLYAEYKSVAKSDRTISWAGYNSVAKIMEQFDISDPNFVKPGINETTRMLLIRVPWKILVKDLNDPNREHIFMLAKEKNVEIVEYTDMAYACCGLIEKITK